MRKIILLSLLILSSCNSNQTVKPDESNLLSQVEKKIYQNVDVAGMGMLENLIIESVEQIDSVTFQAAHSFMNPMLEREMRITNKYTLTIGLDSIINKEDVKMEMKSEGEWVDFNF